jgi:hypothetical protein
MKTNKTFAYGLFAVILVLSLTGCPDPDPTHTHDYGTEWKSNATQHWRECSCGDKTDVNNHTAGDWIVDQAATATIDGSKHKECTVCGYETETETIPATGEGHIHDYGTEWKSNETQHWHECSCGDKTDVANHSGDPCDICGYTASSPDNEEPIITSYSATPASITVPAENSVQLTCTATSADGSAVKSIQWTVEQKPALANPTIANAQTDTVTVNDMNVAGTYQFKLVVTGNNDVTKTEYVTVIAGLDYEVEFVTPVMGETTIDLSPANNLPTGVTYILTDNLDNTYDSGTGFNISINDGPYENTTTYTFTQTFKMNGVVVGSQNILIRVLNGLFASLRDANNVMLNLQAIPSVTLKWPADPLSAHAQAAPTHTLANNLTITLNGTGSTGNISAYAWECESYTANQGAVSAVYSKAQVDALITNAGTATATVAPRKAGTYVFKLTVTGDEGEGDTDTVAVVVEAMTHTITVPAITLANPLNFGTVSALTGWNSDFASTDVTYVLTLENTAQPTNTTSINATGRSDGYYILTQTFYYKGNLITNGSRSVVIEVDGNMFADMHATMPPPYTTVNIPELPLLLSKGELETVNLPLNVTVSFVSLGVPNDAIDFSPDASLPAGVTYILTDNSTQQKSWNSAEGFGGQITASEHYSVAGDITFTQSFYLNGVEITGTNSKRTVVVVVGTFPNIRFTAFVSDTGSVTLKWPAE